MLIANRQDSAAMSRSWTSFNGSPKNLTISPNKTKAVGCKDDINPPMYKLIFDNQQIESFIEVMFLGYNVLLRESYKKRFVHGSGERYLTSSS